MMYFDLAQSNRLVATAEKSLLASLTNSGKESKREFVPVGLPEMLNAFPSQKDNPVQEIAWSYSWIASIVHHRRISYIVP